VASDEVLPLLCDEIVGHSGHEQDKTETNHVEVGPSTLPGWGAALDGGFSLGRGKDGVTFARKQVVQLGVGQGALVAARSLPTRDFRRGGFNFRVAPPVRASLRGFRLKSLGCSGLGEALARLESEKRLRGI
jgi:hypothetical protein